jgi:hypothetical protein
MPPREEGPLSNRENQKKAQEAEAKARRVIFGDIRTLENVPEFRRWMGRLCQRCGLTDAFNTSNGSEMFRFEGRRSIAVEVVKEFDDLVPGFYERVLAARRAFENELRSEPQQEENDDD